MTVEQWSDVERPTVAVGERGMRAVAVIGRTRGRQQVVFEGGVWARGCAVLLGPGQRKAVATVSASWSSTSRESCTEPVKERSPWTAPSTGRCWTGTPASASLRA